MPGISAVFDGNDAASVSQQLGAMQESLRYHDWYTTETWAPDGGGVGLGRCSLGVVNTAPQPAVLGAMTAVMDGELYDYAEQRRRLEGLECRFSSESHADVLLHGYQQEGTSFFARLNGKFVAAIWDAEARRLLVVNDRFGMKPLYYAHRPAKLLVASEIKAIFTDPQVSRAPNMRGLAQFFTFGQYLAEDTSFAAVRLLPAAGCLVYDADQDTVTLERYWQPPVGKSNGMAEPELLERIDDALYQSVDRRASGTHGLGLSLSGGLDARTILGLIDHERISPTTVAMGMEGCRDHRSASELAALCKCRHHNYVLQPDFLAQFQRHLNEMVSLTDGQYLSQCIVMPTLPYYRAQGIRVLLRGHAGELLHMNKAYNFSLDRESLTMTDDAIESWAFNHLRAYMLKGVDGPLFAGGQGAELDVLAGDSLRECLQQSAGLMPPVQRVSHLFLTQRSRRETALSLVKFGSVVETRLPYLDNQLIDVLMATPPALKMGERIQGAILRRHRPEFLNVVNVNTGTRMGASKAAQKCAGLKQRVFSKLGVRGYQPYERLGLWLRKDLRPLVEDMLLGDRCLSRGLFHPDTTRQIVAQHTQRKRNHTFLIMAMMICELGQRKFVDQME